LVPLTFILKKWKLYIEARFVGH